MKFYLIILFALVATGSASNKGVVKLEQFNVDSKEIVIMKDEPTREGVLPILVQWLHDNGFSAKVAQSYSEVDPSKYIFSYRAWWGWDIAIYMRRVEMRVRLKDETLGAIDFDSLKYGGFGKFGNSEARLRILLDVLFGKITREEADKRLGEA